MSLSSKVDADYIYCLLNGRRMTFHELASFARLDTLALTKALCCLREEQELCEYTEDGVEYLELRCGYQI